MAPLEPYDEPMPTRVDKSLGHHDPEPGQAKPPLTGAPAPPDVTFFPILVPIGTEW